MKLKEVVEKVEVDIKRGISELPRISIRAEVKWTNRKQTPAP